jgi:hypothetical protein
MQTFEPWSVSISPKLPFPFSRISGRQCPSISLHRDPQAQGYFIRHGSEFCIRSLYIPTINSSVVANKHSIISTLIHSILTSKKIAE